MTSTGLWYRGVSLQRVGLGRGHMCPPWDMGAPWTDYWVTRHGDQICTWNEILGWVDKVQEDEPFPDMEKHHDNALPPHYCVDCGQRDLLGWEDRTREKLEATGLCFDCLHWAQARKAMAGKSWKHFVSKGSFYTIGDTYEGGGFGGTRWHVTWPCGHVEDTKNLWHGGDVPEHWRERLPDNAELVSVR